LGQQKFSLSCDDVWGGKLSKMLPAIVQKEETHDSKDSGGDSQVQLK
jgi:hypothetical protein